jgi:cyclopropane-fatty-acyl-phospholipid synthase
MRGEIEIDDLTSFFMIMIKNRNASDTSSILFWLGSLWSRVQHRFGRANNISNAQQNIHEHYDLSNEMFETFLDPTMMYSCAVFEKPEDSLHQAQITKLHKIIREADIKSTDHVLEIGSGWGSFAIEAVKKTGCRVTTGSPGQHTLLWRASVLNLYFSTCLVTISEEQYALAKQRIEEAGLQDRIDLKFLDYRKIEGKFDKVVSIEMIEAVGHEFLPEYFATIDKCLKPDGVAYIQAITYPDSRYEQYRRGCDFIQKYIFPGGLCPSITAMADAMTKSSSLQIEHLDNIGIHYAQTLRLWRDNFIANREKILKLGFPESFIRRWLYYFAYCEAGFETKVLGTLHLLLTRPGNESIKHLEYHVC